MPLRTTLRYLAQLILAVACLSAQTAFCAREWTSTDGKKIEAEFLSESDAIVSLKLATGQVAKVPLGRLSEADIAWVLDHPSPLVKPLTGPYAHLITGKWELASFEGAEFAIYGARGLDPAKKYPVVVAWNIDISLALPDQVKNGTQLVDWVKTFSATQNYWKRPCIVIAPTIPGMFYSNFTQLFPHLLSNLPIDRKRIYTVGAGNGGMIVFYFACSDAAHIAGCVAVGGAAAGHKDGPKELHTDHLKFLSNTPFQLVRTNTIEDQDFQQDMPEVLKAWQGRKDFKYTEIPLSPIDAASKFFADPANHEWLFSQSLKAK